jgi:hypothetical protein
MYISVLILFGINFLREKFVVDFHITLHVDDTCWYLSWLAKNRKWGLEQRFAVLFISFNIPCVN